MEISTKWKTRGTARTGLANARAVWQRAGYAPSRERGRGVWHEAGLLYVDRASSSGQPIPGTDPWFAQQRAAHPADNFLVFSAAKLLYSGPDRAMAVKASVAASERGQSVYVMSPVPTESHVEVSGRGRGAP